MNWMFEIILEGKYPHSQVNEENGKVSIDIGELLLRIIRERIVIILWSITLFVFFLFMAVLASTEGLGQESFIFVLLTVLTIIWCLYEFDVVFELLKGE